MRASCQRRPSRSTSWRWPSSGPRRTSWRRRCRRTRPCSGQTACLTSPSDPPVPLARWWRMRRKRRRRRRRRSLWPHRQPAPRRRRRRWRPQLRQALRSPAPSPRPSLILNPARRREVQRAVPGTRRRSCLRSPNPGTGRTASCSTARSMGTRTWGTRARRWCTASWRARRGCRWRCGCACWSSRTRTSCCRWCRWWQSRR
mmetsp:Transcript_24947/g.80348  ORF Transcript_24947/g.80348 Transcript_24947/m.80348 type:complete len:201 (-) Transcript_24947:1764-2366(-)